MESTTLGRSGLHVSRATLGTLNFDPALGGDDTSSRRVLDAFLDAGGTTVDTADVYGDGRCEEIVGRAVAARREDVVLATKGAMPVGPGPNDHGLSRRHLTRALEASLRRLDTDHVDLYQIHRWFPGTPIEETMATLDGFVRSGKVRHLGCSNFTAAQIVESQWAAHRIGGTPFVGLQPHYSLLAREIETEIGPTCVRQGIGVLAYAPLASGVLAGRYRRDSAPEPGSRIDRWQRYPVAAAGRWAASLLTDAAFGVVDRVVAVARELGSTPAAVAIAWLLRQPNVSSVLIGPRDTSQLPDNLAGLDLVLPDDLAESLDLVSAPVGGPVTGMPAGVSS